MCRPRAKARERRNGGRRRIVAAGSGGAAGRSSRLACAIRGAQSYIAICNLQATYGIMWTRACGMKRPTCSPRTGRSNAGRGFYVGQDRVRQYLLPFPRSSGARSSITCSSAGHHIDPSGASASGRWRAFILIACWAGKPGGAKPSMKTAIAWSTASGRSPGCTRSSLLCESPCPNHGGFRWYGLSTAPA